MKKRFFTLLLALLMSLSVFAGCAPKNNPQPHQNEEQENNNNEPITEQPGDKDGEKAMRIGLLKGPTALGAVMLMNEVDNGKVFGNYKFELFTTPDEITAKIINNELDAAAIPVNMASVIYNTTKGKISTVAINTLGTLYVVEKSNDVKDMSDLSGKTLVMAGQGSVPEYVLQFILSKAGVTDCNIEFVQSHAEAAAAVAGGAYDIALLPEPFVSVAISKNPDITIAIDVAEKWDAYSYEEDVPNTLTMGCLVVRKEFVDNYTKEFNKFLDEYEYFIEVAVEDVETSAEKAVEYGMLEDKDIAAKAIPNCNIVFIEGGKMLRLVENFLNIMYEANPKSIGGEIPDEEFYYVRKY